MTYSMPCPYAKAMPAMKALIAAMIVLAAAPSGEAFAQSRRGDQDDAYHHRRLGTLKPLRDIEGGVVPEMRRRGADYIGAEYDGDEGRYRLKFTRGRSVIWVDVDGRTGAVVGRAGD